MERNEVKQKVQELVSGLSAIDKAVVLYSDLWKATKDETPQENITVLCAYQVKCRDEGGIGFGVNIATYKEGVWTSFNNDVPDYWMYIPPIVQFWDNEGKEE